MTNTNNTQEAKDYITRVTKTQGRLLDCDDLFKGYKSTHKERISNELFAEIWLDKNAAMGNTIKNMLEELAQLF